MTTYYCSFSGTQAGLDTLNGLREPTTGHYHSDGTCTSTTTICSSLTSAADDFYNGAFIWNRTRGLGAMVTDYVGSTKQLVHGSITGNAQTDEFYVICAWKTLNKIATTITAGDTCYVQANTTDTLTAVINYTNDGTNASNAKIIGMGTGSATLETTDETVTEAWHTSSTVRPIISGNNNVYYLYLSGDHYWYHKNLDFRYSNITGYANVNLVGSFWCTFDNCRFYDGVHASGYGGCLVTGGGFAMFYNCAFTNNKRYGIAAINGGQAYCYNCTFDSGANATNYGAFLSGGGGVYLESCTLGSSSAHALYDLYAEYGFMNARNCVCSSGSGKDYYADYWSEIYLEDHDGTIGNNITVHGNGTIIKTTSTVRSGGASSSAEMIPTSGVGTTKWLTMNSRRFPDFRIWCAPESTTFTVYIRGLNWASFPTNTQLWLSAEYVTDDTAGAITRATVNSTQTLSDNSTWVGFSCNVTPHVASWVNLKVNLALYEDATTGIYVDVLPVVS